VNGEILYSRMRLYHPERKEKLIRPFCNTGTGFKFGEPKFSGKKPLYNLPLIKDAQTIFWVEGEQKADRLCELGIVATTSGGAIYRQEPYQAVSTATVMATYTIGL